MHIRAAQIEDTPRLVFLGRQLLQLHETFDIDYYRLEQSFDTLFADYIKQHIQSSYQFVLVACENDQVIGFINGFIKSLFPWFTTKSVGHISYLITDPQFRKIGVGKKLEKAAISWFKMKNISYVEVYTDEKNTVGGIVWSSYGYLPFKKFLRKKI